MVDVQIGQPIEYRDFLTGERRTDVIALVRDGKFYVRNSWDHNSYTQVTPISDERDVR